MSLPLWIQSFVLLKFLATCKSVPVGAAVVDHVPVSAIVNSINYPRYAFSYTVIDPHTNDKKAHWETREGNEVNGAYSLLEPDGNVRVVEYNANDVKGFTAVVKKLGPNLHPAQVIASVPAVVEHVPPPVIAEPVHHPEPVPVILTPTHPPNTLVEPAKIEISHVPVEPVQQVGVPNASYGLGGVSLPIEVPHVVYEKGSHPWDPITGTFGGWRPLPAPGPKIPYATIYSRKYINGNLHKITAGPISLVGKTLYIRKTHS